MRNNIEKWNYYKKILDERAEIVMDQADTTIPSKNNGHVFEKFYQIGYYGNIIECYIDSRYYNFGIGFHVEKPTKKAQSPHALIL